MNSDNEARNSFRAAIVDHCEGVLLIDDAQIRVCILNQSATGFKLSTEDQRPIPEMMDALLDLKDGVRHVVQIRHVERDGSSQALGVKLLETQLHRPSESGHIVAARRKSITKAVIAVLLIIACTFALQAAPIRNHLAGVFNSPVHQKPAAKTVVVPSKRPQTPISNSKPRLPSSSFSIMPA